MTLTENSASMSRQCFTARTLSDGLQADALSDEPLLISLEMASIDWPSSCRSGNCRTCIGQLVSGTVRYEMDWPGLAPDEIAEGFVLPCVAYPCSDVVLRLGY